MMKKTVFLILVTLFTLISVSETSHTAQTKAAAKTEVPAKTTGTAEKKAETSSLAKEEMKKLDEITKSEAGAAVSSDGVTVSGKVSAPVIASANGIKKAGNFGVFVFVEETGAYDITDFNGGFAIKGLKTGKTYTLVFQKAGLSETRKKVSVKKENLTIEVELRGGTSYTEAPVNENEGTGKKAVVKKTVPKKSTPVKQAAAKQAEAIPAKTAEEPKKAVPLESFLKGRIVSESADDVFIEFKGKGYGFVVKSAEEFSRKIEPGKYTIVISQKGMKSYSAEVEANEGDNNIGTINLVWDKRFEMKIDTSEYSGGGNIAVYSGGLKVLTRSIEAGSKEAVIPGLPYGEYKVVLKAPGYKAYTAFVKENEIKDEKIKIVPLAEKTDDSHLVTVDVKPEFVDAVVNVYDADYNIIVSKTVSDNMAEFEGLNDQEDYTVEISAGGYKTAYNKRVRTGDNLKVILEREIKGAGVSGTVYPFGSFADLMLLSENEILAKTVAEENGNFYIGTEEKADGRLVLKVSAEGYEDYYKEIEYENGVLTENVNIALKPVYTTISGKVKLEGKKEYDGIIVTLDEMNLWSVTDENGYFYFRNIPEGIYNISFKKLGFEVRNIKTVVVKEQIKNIEETLVGYSTVVIRANTDNYNVTVDSEKIKVQQKLKEIHIYGLGQKEIVIEKKDYIPFKAKFINDEYGLIKNIDAELEAIADYKKRMKELAGLIEEKISRLAVSEAETLMETLKKDNYNNMFNSEIDKLSKKIVSAKKSIFDNDNRIREEIKRMRDYLTAAEITSKDVVSRRRFIDENCREAIEAVEALNKKYPVNSVKYEINMWMSEIYAKMGMAGSAESSKKEAEKYKN